MPDINSMLADLDDLYRQQEQLRHHLHMSLAIQEFMPDAFEHGSCKIGGRSTETAPDKGTVVFTLGNDEKREFPAAQVPLELWPSAMRENLRQHKPRLNRRLAS